MAGARAQRETLLRPMRRRRAMQRLVLGTDLGQCCGGVVEVWMERLRAADRALLLGAASDALRQVPRVLIEHAHARTACAPSCAASRAAELSERHCCNLHAHSARTATVLRQRQATITFLERLDEDVSGCCGSTAPATWARRWPRIAGASCRCA